MLAGGFTQSYLSKPYVFRSQTSELHQLGIKGGIGRPSQLHLCSWEGSLKDLPIGSIRALP